MYRMARKSREYAKDQECGQESGQKECFGEKTPIARSMLMQPWEIERERELSGWNPYEGEEEIPEQEECSREKVSEQGDCAGEEDPPLRPYFMEPDYAGALEREQETERELRRIQAMYPEAAKAMLPCIEEECDKMEYEGSPMFDEYPDRTTVYRMEERVYDQVKDRLPEAPAQAAEDVLSMQYPAPGADRRGGNLVRDLARVLLLQEMHHRRCRYHSRKRTDLPFLPVSGIV